MKKILIGIDTGGTFTDFVIYKDGKLEIKKIPSTPNDPSIAILKGIKNYIKNDTILTIIHGSTVATNALLERKGAKVAFITTRGFEDIIFIGRQTRKFLYNLKGEKGNYLVSPNNCFGLLERTLSSGLIEKRVSLEELKKIIAKLKFKKIESVAVVFINSYINPKNERTITKELRKNNILVSASSEILPEYREYERASTTLINAYVMPVINDYLKNLESKILNANLKIMQSNEGFISSKRARKEAVKTILSGPAGGVVGAFYLNRLIGNSKVITFDMGGTSTDVSLIDNEIKRTTEAFIEDFPLRTPIIDIHTVGAGGGSIAYIDQGGALRVGPQSAGADPGPACYGKSFYPTVTDANLILGRLDPENFLGGEMKIYPERSIKAIEKLAKKLNKSIKETASGIIQIANANMERAIRVISIERGYDPRNFVLFSFGGAGGMHSVDLAIRLKIPIVIIPKRAGVLSALGMLLADSVKDYTRSILKTLDQIDKKKINEVFKEMINEGIEEMKEEGFSLKDISIFKFMDVRYLGQSYEITVPYSSNFIEDFHHRHRALYSYSHLNRPVEIVNLRIKCIGKTEKVVLPKYSIRRKIICDNYSKKQKIFYNGEEYEGKVFLRDNLQPGDIIKGPSLILDFESTAFIPPAFFAEVDSYLNLIIKGE